MVSSWVPIGIAICTVVIVLISSPWWLHYIGRNERAIDQLRGDLNITGPQVTRALEAFNKHYPNEGVKSDELEKRTREAGYDFNHKLNEAKKNERAKKVCYEEYIDVLRKILEDVVDAEREVSQRRVSEESFDSARIQAQGQDEGMELQDLRTKSSKSV
ncbi:MAG: hypothetical protein HETSPECPRED_004503 [Heterodermia speciosa]|uniref:Uncharacterized protein n=1 Tax=Heterodermia speciosa TaxID=116794 RepID=A0A8H3IAX0_9LECA|nr:MAG: hypothetical protein HETSPECPRED_004503 [Heterodermia speciosa]